MQAYVDGHRDQSITLTIVRAGRVMTTTVRPTASKENNKGIIGVNIAEIGTVRYPWYRAIGEGFLAAFYGLKQIFIGFYSLLSGIFHGAGVDGAVSGPVGVAVMTGEVAHMGFIYLIQFVAVLSLNLAVLNILPIPALDGGRLFFVLIATLLRRPVKARVEQWAHLIGFVALMILVISVTVKDLSAFSGPVSHWIKNIF
jgi:regulator of sigma E protease